MTLFYEIPGGSIITATGKEVVRVQVSNLHPSESAQIMDAIMNALEGLEKKWKNDIDMREAQMGADLLLSLGVKFH